MLKLTRNQSSLMARDGVMGVAGNCDELTRAVFKLNFLDLLGVCCLL